MNDAPSSKPADTPSDRDIAGTARGSIVAESGSPAVAPAAAAVAEKAPQTPTEASATTNAGAENAAPAATPSTKNADLPAEQATVQANDQAAKDGAPAEAAEPSKRKRRRRRRRKRKNEPGDNAGAAANAPQGGASKPAVPAPTKATGGLHSLTVKVGHVQPIWAGHPWVFAQAVQKVDNTAGPGDEVVVIDPHGKVLGRGLYSPKSAIAARLFTPRGAESIDRALLQRRIEQALRRRQAQQLPSTQLGAQTNGYRLVHGEGDNMPGLIVDVYGDTLVVQLNTVGLVRLKEDLVAALREVVGPQAILDRTPPAAGKAEGFKMPQEDARQLHGDAPTQLSFMERGLKFQLPLALTQKTGFYFDQRPLRARIEQLSRGSRVLDGCCYVGAIALAAARGGASQVLAVDRSSAAIEAGKACAALNGFEGKIDFVVGDIHKQLEKAEKDGGFDIVVCDPPKLAPQRRNRQHGLSGYRRMAAGACRATKEGGIVALCSCSASVSADALQRALALGARDAGRRAVVFERLFQGPDHPVAAAFPEGLYLKVLLARVETL